MILSVVLTVAVAMIFIVLGLAGALALPKMREKAAQTGFSVAAYRRIGGAQMAGAIGVALGPAVPALGGLAGAGLLSLLAAAVFVHLRKGDGVPELAPAIVCAVLVAAYLAVLFA
ncbi:MAG: invasion protein [Streptomyces sp.]|nr:invasion protein [Streptomyces sp.]